MLRETDRFLKYFFYLKDENFAQVALDSELKKNLILRTYYIMYIIIPHIFEYF